MTLGTIQETKITKTQFPPGMEVRGGALRTALNHPPEAQRHQRHLDLYGPQASWGHYCHIGQEPPPPPRPVAITFTCSDHITFLVITRKLWLPPKRLTWQDTQVRAKLRTRAAQGWARGHQVGKWTPRREEAGRMTLLQGHTPDDTRAASLHCEARWAAAANLTENEVCHRSPSGPGPRTSLFSYPPIGFLGLL